jgi:hypothetical protein
LPPAGALVPVCRLTQSLNWTRTVLYPGVFVLATLAAITSIARCCAIRREVATEELMSMKGDPEGALPWQVKVLP